MDVAEPADEEGAPVRQSTTLLNEHLGLVVTSAAGAIIAVRLLRVSHGDLDTAFEVLRTTGTAPVLIAVALTVIPTIALVALAAALLHLPKVQLQQPSIATAFYYALLGPLILVVPLRTVGFVAIGAIVGWVARRISQRTGRGQAGKGLDPDYVGIALGIAATLLILTPDRPWLPSEVVSSKNGPPETVYVLDESDDWIRLMSDNDRTVTTIAKSDLASREICRLPDANSSSNRSILDVFTDRPDYPRCPEIVE